MIIRITIALTLAVSMLCKAASADEMNARIVEQHILPGYADLATKAGALSESARNNCKPTSPALRQAFHDSFDAWLRVSHLRFGPSEVDNRAFALSFWPDPRSKRRKALSRLIAERDPLVESLTAFQTISIAGRGFYALEYLLFGPQPVDADEQVYRCSLVHVIARDIAATAGALSEDWNQRYSVLVLHPGTADSPYKTALEVKQEFFKALATGLQFASDARIGRPMGSFDRPRPQRAEARLSSRSLHNLQRALEGQRALANLLSENEAAIATRLDQAFASIDAAATDVAHDPVFAEVADIQGRLRVEILQQSINVVREIVQQELGPALGISKGFNALDGD